MRSCWELVWSVFSGIWTELREIQSISPYSVQLLENTDQHNSKYGHFSRTALEVFYEEDLRTAVSTDYGVSDRHGGHQFNTFVPNSSINKLSPNVFHTTLLCLKNIMKASQLRRHTFVSEVAGEACNFTNKSTPSQV